MEYDTRYTMDLQRKYYSALEELHLHRNSAIEEIKKHEKKVADIQKKSSFKDDKIELLKEQIDRTERSYRFRKSKQTSTIKKLRAENSELTSKVKELENKFTTVDQMLAEKEQTAKEWRDEAFIVSTQTKNHLRKKLAKDNESTKTKTKTKTK